MRCRNNSRKGEQGSVLVLAMMVLAVLGVVIAGLSRDVLLDLNITRNLRMQNSAFNWAETGLEVTEDLVSMAMDLRSEDNGTVFSETIAGDSYSVVGVAENGTSLMFSDGTVTVKKNGQSLSEVTVEYMGAETGDGNSIIIAAGYEGFGMGAGSGVSRQFFYHLTSNGTSSTGNGRYRMAEVYTHVAR